MNPVSCELCGSQTLFPADADEWAMTRHVGEIAVTLLLNVIVYSTDGGHVCESCLRETIKMAADSVRRVKR